MKGLLVLLCVLVAAQARSTGVKSGRVSSSSSDNPWVVHLRVAVSTSGLLNSCVGSLIDHRWVLTSATCLENNRFIWLRYGAESVWSPTLVTETSTVRVNPDLDLALISINRPVEYKDKIAAVAIAKSDAAIPASGNLCGYGANDDGGAGESLKCSKLALVANTDGSIDGKSENGLTTEFDLGAPLVVDGVQFGVLVKPGETSVFLNPALSRDWIERETGIDLSPEEEDEDEDEEEDEARIVHFVN